MQNLLLKIAFLLLIAQAANAQKMPGEIKRWQELKKGQPVLFDSAAAIPIKDFRENQRMFKALDKANLEIFSTMQQQGQELEELKKINKDLTHTVGRVTAENQYHLNTIKELQAALAAKPGKGKKK